MSSASSPFLLRPDNFTPPSRTPWGGRRLTRDLKRGWLPEGSEDLQVGESWEVSVEPDFPARLEDGSRLDDYIARAPELLLGDEHRRGRAGTALLVKLIDADEPLSLQIHPSDDYTGLQAGECGKPESWYVVEREPGAGLYLGFREGTREADVRDALEGRASLREMLRFVPVERGDFFVIDAGTPHAIGAGLTLVEPQHVMPGMRGVTYRYWDWDRLYDARGLPSPGGAPRPLHVKHALEVTDWDRVQRSDFVDAIRLRAGQPNLAGRAELAPLAGPGGLESPYLYVARLTGNGALALPDFHRLMAITVLDGSVQAGDVVAERGRSLVVPASAAGTRLQLTGAHAILSAVGPGV